VYRSRLLDPNTDEKVGVDVANCLANSSGRVVCTGYFQINDRGQIWTQWVQDLRSPEGYVMAISGGTGEFANVRGKVTAPEAGASVDLTFDLLP
jgi:hypothetical protein